MLPLELRGPCALRRWASALTLGGEGAQEVQVMDQGMISCAQARTHVIFNKSASWGYEKIVHKGKRGKGWGTAGRMVSTLLMESWMDWDMPILSQMPSFISTALKQCYDSAPHIADPGICKPPAKALEPRGP